MNDQTHVTATMDSMTVDQAALQNLSQKDKQELSQFIANETQKANIQQSEPGL